MTTPFVIENNVIPLKYLINIVNKNDTLYNMAFCFLKYVEPPKLHEGLTPWFTKTENFTQSTIEVVVPYSTIKRQTTQLQCTSISEADPDISIRGRGAFYFRNNIF